MKNDRWLVLAEAGATVMAIALLSGLAGAGAQLASDRLELMKVLRAKGCLCEPLQCEEKP